MISVRKHAPVVFRLAVLAALMLLAAAYHPGPARADAAPPTVDTVDGNTAVGWQGNPVTLQFSKDMMASPPAAPAGFAVTVNGTPDAVTSVQNPGGSNAAYLWLYLQNLVKHGDTVNVSYTPGTITAADGGVLAAFTLTNIPNYVPAGFYVTYNGNGNTGGSVTTDTQNPYQSGATVTVLGNTGGLVKTGYNFGGWNTQADGTGTNYLAGDTFSITADTALYARWILNANNCTVTYDGNGSTGGSPPTDPNSPYQVNATVTVLGNTGSLVKNGCTFSGWNTQADGTGTTYQPLNTFTMGSSNITLYARWTVSTYTVSYDGNGETGGSPPTDSNSYHYNDTVTVLGNTGNLEKPNCTFGGWNTEADGTGTTYQPGATFTITTNIMLYALWTANTFTVTYDGNGSTGGSPPTDSNSPYPVNATVTVLGNTGGLARTGYTFDVWDTKADGTGTAYKAGDHFTMGSANVTLYARWTVNIYTVTYNGNGETGGSVPTDGNSYHAGDTVTVLANALNLVKTGYTFGGWNTQADGTGTTYQPVDHFTMGSANVTLYALWTVNTYTVTYGGNGNTGGVVPIDAGDYHNGDSVTVLAVLYELRRSRRLQPNRIKALEAFGCITLPGHIS